MKSKNKEDQSNVASGFASASHSAAPGVES